MMKKVKIIGAGISGMVVGCYLQINGYDTYRYHRKKFDIKNRAEVVDVTTPATFNRYTNNWKGSIQGWMPSKKQTLR